MQGDFIDIAKSSHEEAALATEFMSEIENLNATSNKLKKYMKEFAYNC